MTIVILGATGMLGGTVHEALKRSGGCTVTGTARRPVRDLVHFDVREGFATCPIDFGAVDYVINCIGITKPYCHDDNLSEVQNAISINALFPHALAQLAAEKDFRVIQIATDCVFSGRTGGYAEDATHDPADMYGKTKSMGEVMASPRLLNIRCSIIGPEAYHSAFLLEWFLKQPEGAQVRGFEHHRWNGVTTLQFAQLCDAIITQGQFDVLAGESPVHHFVPNETVSKYELLSLFNEVYGKRVTVQPYRDGDAVDRTLTTRHHTLARIVPTTSLRTALQELRGFQQWGAVAERASMGRSAAVGA